MFTLPSSVIPDSPEPQAERFFHPVFLGGMTLLSDKVTSCNGSNNSTNILDRPGATIISPIVLALTGITGLIVALYYLHSTTKPSHNRTVFYILLATLIWTDLIGKLVTTPPAILSYAHGHWIGGKKLCNLHGFSMMTIDLVTHFLVSAMALDRFLCVRHCYFYKACVTKSRARILLMAIWMFSIVFCALPLFGLGEYESQYPGTWCFVDLHTGVHTPWYHRIYANVFGVLNVVNVFIILICNLIVIGSLISTRIFRSRKLSASARQPQRNTSLRELEFQMSVVLLVITLVFLVSWSPLDFRLFLNQIWPHTCREEHISDLVAVRLASFNQIIDPWVYIICRRVFTSKVWRSCRSLVLGRNFSSKRKNNSVNLIMLQNAEKGESSTKAKISDSLTSFKRKCSLPITDKSKMVAKVSFKTVNETKTDQKVFDELKHAYEEDKLTSEKRLGHDVNQNKKYIPFYKRHLSQRVIGAVKNENFQPMPITALTRRQFRMTSKPMEISFTDDYRSTCSKSTQSYMHPPVESQFGMIYLDSVTVSETCQHRKQITTGRRHSWSGTPSVYKHYRSRSTQTLEDE